MLLLKYKTYYLIVGIIIVFVLVAPVYSYKNLLCIRYRPLCVISIIKINVYDMNC